MTALNMAKGVDPYWAYRSNNDKADFYIYNFTFASKDVTVYSKFEEIPSDLLKKVAVHYILGLPAAKEIGNIKNAYQITHIEFGIPKFKGTATAGMQY